VLTLVTTMALHHRFHGPRVDYVAVAAAAALSWFVITGPGEAVLIAAGLAAAHHRVDIASVIGVAWVGAMVGGAAGWATGLKGGRALVLAPGPFLRRRRRMVASGERLYERYGVLAVYLAPSWMAGINAMPPVRFLIADAIATLVWAMLVGLGAFLVGPSIADIAGDIGLLGLTAIALVAIAGVVVRRRRRRQRTG
jgi:membrane protein DedA with SNARE-associated domain